MKKYNSITTPAVQHSEEQALVEVYLLHKYKDLPKFPWRKASGFSKEWGTVLSIMRRLVKSRQLSPREILDLFIRHDLTVAWDKIGLLYWHVDNSFFEEMDLDRKLQELQPLHDEPVVEVRKKVGMRDLLRKKNSETSQD
jgi:hypothetical protein